MQAFPKNNKTTFRRTAYSQGLWEVRRAGDNWVLLLSQRHSIPVNKGPLGLAYLEALKNPTLHFPYFSLCTSILAAPNSIWETLLIFKTML